MTKKEDSEPALIKRSWARTVRKVLLKLRPRTPDHNFDAHHENFDAHEDFDARENFDAHHKNCF